MTDPDKESSPGSPVEDPRRLSFPGVGEMFGHYEIVARLGAGGMGSVFAALDTKLNRQVALKFPNIRGPKKDELRERFQREARLAASISHPNVCTIHAVGDLQGVHYLDQQLIVGRTLRDFRLDQGGRVEIEEALSIIRCISGGLQQLHKVNVIHRDLKPQNIMMDSEGRPVILDFGLAKCATDVDSDISEPGGLIGTPLYGSPEQLAGKSNRNSPPTDIYALGVILFELITGETPYSGNNILELMAAKMDPPIPPSSKFQEIDPKIDRLCLRMMALSPVDRFQSTDELIVEISQYLGENGSNASGSAGDPILDDEPKNEEVSTTVHSNVQFTVYRPKAIRPEEWYTLLGFAHLDERPDDAPEDEPDPVEHVKEIAKRELGKNIANYKNTSEDIAHSIPHNGELTFVPEVEGVEFKPLRQTIAFSDSVQNVKFELRTSQSNNDRILAGRFSVFLGAILIAEITLKLKVDGKTDPPKDTTHEQVPVQRFRRIYACYSKHDQEIVGQLEALANSLGDQFIHGFRELRAGEITQARIQEMIRDSDLFQLFWSNNSMNSPHCRREWEYALGLGRRGFIRPTYWEEPFPSSPHEGLPPEELERLHFTSLAIRNPAPPLMDRILDSLKKSKKSLKSTEVVRTLSYQHEGQDYHARLQGQKKYKLGRSNDSAIPIPQSCGFVGRHHATIIEHNDHWFIEDNGSRNGTFINNERIDHRAQIKGGDIIHLGWLEIAFYEHAVGEEVFGVSEARLGGSHLDGREQKPPAIADESGMIIDNLSLDAPMSPPDEQPAYYVESIPSIARDSENEELAQSSPVSEQPDELDSRKDDIVSGETPEKNNTLVSALEQGPADTGTPENGFEANASLGFEDLLNTKSSVQGFEAVTATEVSTKDPPDNALLEVSEEHLYTPNLSMDDTAIHDIGNSGHRGAGYGRNKPQESRSSSSTERLFYVTLSLIILSTVIYAFFF